MSTVQNYDHSSNISTESDRKEVLPLHHEKEKSRCSAQAQDVMGRLIFTEVSQPPYSSDMTPSYFRLFPNLKETLKGQLCSTDAEVQADMHNG
ncbi:hypothetical protein TNCV_1242741 [Trichonephila clavipes]|nr:hypothetical protein TNCV_1242741 [Trichonephila clavipes]